MDNNAQAALYALASVAFLYVIGSSWNLGRRLPNMPPGPPTKPIIGNMLDMTNLRLHLRFHEWGESTFRSEENYMLIEHSQTIWGRLFRQGIGSNHDRHQFSNSLERSPRQAC